LPILHHLRLLPSTSSPRPGPLVLTNFSPSALGLIWRTGSDHQIMDLLLDASSRHAPDALVRHPEFHECPPIWNTLAQQASFRDPLRYHQMNHSWFTLEDGSIWLPPWSRKGSSYPRYVEHIKCRVATVYISCIISEPSLCFRNYHIPLLIVCHPQLSPRRRHPPSLSSAAPVYRTSALQDNRFNPSSLWLASIL
jgi:hypothetical protein